MEFEEVYAAHEKMQETLGRRINVLLLLGISGGSYLIYKDMEIAGYLSIIAGILATIGTGIDQQIILSECLVKEKG